MARRRSSSPSLSLFAFQDIITGVAGVMLFILLLLVVQLAIQTSVTHASKPENQPDASTTEKARLLEQQYQIATMEALVERKKIELESNKTKVELMLDARVVDIDQELEARKAKIAKLRNELSAITNQVSSLRSENEKLRSSDPAKALLSEMEKMKEEIRSLESQTLEWKDETRVNYKTDNIVKNLYLFDVQGTHCTMAVLPFDNRSKRIEYGSDKSVEKISTMMESYYDSLPSARKDPERRIVVLIRPSAAIFATELVRELRNRGFEVAMELLEAKAELFRKPVEKATKEEPLNSSSTNETN
jgi:Na+-transporting methylmalonyl-CoA/oxaloacetate decarboxylase gamma subunit